MVDAFMKILNMSVAASWLIIAAVLLRFLLKKAPRWIAVLLWGIVALRLAVPFSFESTLSLIPSAETFNAVPIPYETPVISGGIPAINHAVDPAPGQTAAPGTAGGIDPLYTWTRALSVIWLVGIAVMLVYAVISFVRVRRRVAERVPYAGNIFLCDHVRSPFILGMVRPKIYLPSDLDAASMEPVLAHEKAHLARRDHWWKPLGFLILAVHWFNPLCWVAYVLLCRDIELACDEKVIRQMDLDGKKQYSSALLACSAQRRLVTVCPLAFGEIGVKERVKKVLHYKKPAFWIIVAAVAACALAAVCFATDPVTEGPGAADGNDVADGNDAADRRKLTLDDVIMLSRKGDALTWADFEPYQGQDIGSGLYIMRYEIDELFEVWVGGVPELEPMYIYLMVNNEAEDRIDIRTEDVSGFIEAHRNDTPKVVEPKPEDGGPAAEEPDFSTPTEEQTATYQAIGTLIETICNSPAQSSDPASYIEEHPAEYRELIGYGRRTLEYCFAEFLKGGQTDLRGHIMRAAMDDIAPEAQLKLLAETGQEYFDAWMDAAISVREQHDPEWIEAHQPAVYLLLSMLGKI